MSLLNIFKKKKPEEKSAEKEVKHVEAVKEIKEEVIIPKKERKSVMAETYKVLKSPHVTEKAGDLAEKNQYIFRIFQRANKTEVKKAIEDAYGVEVVSIKIINVPEKKRKLGKIQGVRPGYKKAIVKIKKGQKIEVLSR